MERKATAWTTSKTDGKYYQRRFVVVAKDWKNEKRDRRIIDCYTRPGT